MAKWNHAVRGLRPRPWRSPPRGSGERKALTAHTFPNHRLFARNRLVNLLSRHMLGLTACAIPRQFDDSIPRAVPTQIRERPNLVVWLRHVLNGRTRMDAPSELYPKNPRTPDGELTMYSRSALLPQFGFVSLKRLSMRWGRYKVHDDTDRCRSTVLPQSSTSQGEGLGRVLFQLHGTPETHSWRLAARACRCFPSGAIFPSTASCGTHPFADRTATSSAYRHCVRSPRSRRFQPCV